MTLVLRYSARSDRGLVRQNNQDSVYAGPRLLALADGMGGHAAGEVASKLVIAALVPLDDDEPGDDLLGELAEATAQGNDAITELVHEEPDLDGMGTTLTAVLFAGSRLGMVHVGDSRAYLFRDGTLTQITRDDTFVQMLVDQGLLSAEEARHHRLMPGEGGGRSGRSPCNSESQGERQSDEQHTFHVQSSSRWCL